MLGGLITTASLPVMHDPDHVEPGCPPNCRICADACPVDALMPEKKQVNIMRCLNYTARTPAMSTLKFFWLRIRNKNDAARYMSMTAFDEHTFHICSKCVSLCPYGSKNENEPSQQLEHSERTTRLLNNGCRRQDGDG
jgi:epoxyqueuosine reductase QueG